MATLKGLWSAQHEYMGFNEEQAEELSKQMVDVQRPVVLNSAPVKQTG